MLIKMLCWNDMLKWLTKNSCNILCRVELDPSLSKGMYNLIISLVRAALFVPRLKMPRHRRLFGSTKKAMSWCLSSRLTFLPLESCPSALHRSLIMLTTSTLAPSQRTASKSSRRILLISLRSAWMRSGYTLMGTLALERILCTRTNVSVKLVILSILSQKLCCFKRDKTARILAFSVSVRSARYTWNLVLPDKSSTKSWFFRQDRRNRWAVFVFIRVSQILAMA